MKPSEFMKLPLEERRRIMREQCDEELVRHYEEEGYSGRRTMSRIEEIIDTIMTQNKPTTPEGLMLETAEAVFEEARKWGEQPAISLFEGKNSEIALASELLEHLETLFKEEDHEQR